MTQLPEDIKILFLDDERKPKDVFGNLVDHSQVEVHQATDYDDFVEFVKRGMSDYDLVSFDHDLGTEKSGKDAAMFMLEKAMDEGKAIPKFSVHSSNPTGAEKIIKMLQKYAEYFPISKVSKNK